MFVYLKVVSVKGLLVIIAVLSTDPISHCYLLQTKTLEIFLTDIDVIFASVLQFSMLDESMKAVHCICEGAFLFLALGDQLLR